MRGRIKKYGTLLFLFPALVCCGCAMPAAKPSAVTPQSQKSLASSYARGGDFIRAIEEIGKVEKLTPRDPETHLIKGIAYFGLKDLKSAEASYKRALEIDGGYTKARYNLCGLLLTTGKPDGAIEHCLKAAEDIRYPFRYAALVNIARAYDMKGDGAAAESFFKQSLRVEPSNIYSRNQYGRFLSKMSRHGEAARQFSAAVSIAPGHNEARLGLAASLMESGDRDSACEQIKRLLKNKPSGILREKARKYQRESCGADSSAR